MKHVSAGIAALVITVLIGVGIVAVGANASLNGNAVPVPASPDEASTVSNAADDAAQVQIKQLQDLLSQYQAHEKQYQAELSDAAQRVKQAESLAQQYQGQVQQYQDILVQLQQRGIIRVGDDGQIAILRRRGGDFGDGDDR